MPLLKTNIIFLYFKHASLPRDARFCRLSCGTDKISWVMLVNFNPLSFPSSLYVPKTEAPLVGFLLVDHQPSGEKVCLPGGRGQTNHICIVWFGFQHHLHHPSFLLPLLCLFLPLSFLILTHCIIFKQINRYFWRKGPFTNSLISRRVGRCEVIISDHMIIGNRIMIPIIDMCWGTFKRYGKIIRIYTLCLPKSAALLKTINP